MASKAIYSLLCTVPLWICASTLLRTDVTVRYEADIKGSPLGGPPAAEKTLQDNLSRFSFLRLKNGKSWSTMGARPHIVDYTTQQMTLLDQEHKTFTTLPMAELADKMSALMPQPQWPDAVKKMMESMKTSVDSKKTGRTDIIAGIQAEETEIGITIEMPGPTGGAAITWKIVMQIWNAKSEETLRNQAVREFTGYNIWSDYFMNPVGRMEKIFGPGFGNAFKIMYDAIAKNRSMMLRMQLQMFKPGAATDANAPMIQVTAEAVEVSSAPLEDSIFQVPADYQAVPAEEFLKVMLAAQTHISAKH